MHTFCDGIQSLKNVCTSICVLECGQSRYHIMISISLINCEILFARNIFESDCTAKLATRRLKSIYYTVFLIAICSVHIFMQSETSNIFFWIFLFDQRFSGETQTNQYINFVKSIYFVRMFRKVLCCF